ncbi:MAG TPA: SBBP repeat-containing protein [Candidatus Acidoferrum sp.]|nr:SBBP repeat-containing protein [Candidatus Acidoferrum sp.]
MNVDRRWLGPSVGRIRVLAAGLVLLWAGCAVLGWNAHSRQTAANVAAQLRATDEPAIESSAIADSAIQDSAIQGQATVPGFLTRAQGLAEEVSGRAQARARSLFAGLPLIFEPNQGQANLDPADRRAKFVTHGSGYSLFLGSDGALLSLVSREPSKRERSRQDGAKPQVSLTRVESLEMKLAGANPNVNVTGADRLPGKSNYFLGNDPAKWRHGVPQFARVRYENVYPGINLLFYGNQGRLEYDFQVAPGSDPGQAELEFNGGKKLELNDGALVIHGEGGSVRLGAPRVYQEIGGKRQSVAGSFVLRGANRAGFAIGSYDHARELVIDPILTFSTYFGGSGDEHSTFVAIDGSFNIYLTGSTTSPNLPAATGVDQKTLAGAQNVYIAKITPPLGSTAASLDYVTYLGGNGTDSPVGINVDGQGDAFVAGTTSSSNFPTTPLTAYQTAPEPGSTGTSHAFVTELKFDATTLQYSSYLSGNGTDIASGVTIDASGFMYVTGTTTSTDAANTTDQFPATTLPQKLPFQVTPRGPIQFFVTKVNTALARASSIAYSTYFGGATYGTPTPVAVGGGIAVDSNGNMYFTGTTNFTFTGTSGSSNSDFPILNAYQPCLNTAPPASPQNPQVCTSSTNTDSDAFVAKLNPNANQGEQLIWSTYVGGSGTDSGMGVGLDSGAANVYLVGTTNSIDIGKGTATAVTSAPLQPCLDNLVDPTTKACTATAGAPSDAFVARLSNPTSTTTTTIPIDVALNYFSYLGGSQNEAGLAIAVDNGSGALVTGWTQSPDFPVLPNPNSIQSHLNGPQNAFVARLNTATVVGQTTAGSWANYFGGSGTDEGTAITLDVNQNAYFAGDTNSLDLQVSKPLQTTNGGGYDAFVTQLGPAVTLSLSGILTLGTNQLFISAGNQATFTYTVLNSGPDLANNITLLDNLSPLITQVPLTFVSATTSAGTCGGGSTNAIVSCSLPSLQAGSTATITIVVSPTPSSTGGAGSFNGGSVQVTGPGNIILAQTSVPAQMSDFSLLITPSNASVPVAGDTASYQIQLTPHPVYGTNISLACTGLPSASACTFTSNPVSLQGPGSSTLNITTTARPVTTPVGSLRTRRFYAIWLMVPGLSLLLVGIGGDARRKRIAGLLSLGVMFALLLLLPACSGQVTQAPVSGTPPGNYTVTVTATSGSDTKSQTVTLSVP